MIYKYEKLIENKQIDTDSILTEAYFGKTENIKKIEENVRVLCDVIQKEAKNNGRKTYLNQLPQAKEINKLVEKEFGFSEATLDWTYDYDTMGSAFTMPCISGIPSIPNIRSKMHYNTTGEVKASNGQKLYICVNPGFILLFGLNPDEVTAILLHEIGHNINLSMAVHTFTALSILSNPLELLGAISGKLQAEALIRNAKGEENMESSKTEEATGQYIEESRKALEDYFTDSSRMYKSITNFLTRVVVAPVNVLFFTVVAKTLKYLDKATKLSVGGYILGNLSSALSGYANEKYSDSFATAFGYGPELMSGLKKFEESLDVVPKTDKEKKWYPMYEFSNLMNHMWLYVFDPHPDTQTRLRSQIDKLRRELKAENLPPEMKKMIEEDLKKAEEIYESFVNLPEEDMRKCTKIARRLSEKVFNGKMNVKEILSFIWKRNDL